ALLQLVGELAAEVHPAQTPKRSVSLDSTLGRELGLDSLARMELIARIERHFGVSLPEHVFAGAETPRDLLAALGRVSTPGKSPLTPKIAPIGAATVGSSVPETVQTLVEVLNWHINTGPDRPHIRIVQEEGQEKVITYRALWQESRAVATGLQALGLQGGQAVVIMLPTGREYFLSFFGAILAGGIPVPIYPPARLSQLEDHMRRHRAILANCRAAVLVTVTEAKLLAHLLKAQVDTLQNIVTVEELCRGEPCTLPALGPHDIAFLQYTSGSTGNPKGVMITHANLLANIRAMGETVRAEPGDVFVSWLPLYHDMGLIGAWLGILYYGAVLIVMSPLAFLAHPQRWLWAIHQYRGTLSAAPNFAYELCLRRIEDQHLEGLDLHSWRAAFNGAEPVSPETVQRFSQRFARYGFQPQAMMPVYGLAEATLGLTLPPPGRVPILDRIQREPFMDRGAAIPAGADDPNALGFIACGRPLKKHEIRIVGPDGHELPDRQEGRLQFRGPSATSGYYRNP
ncbi:MAG TPA: AMP-binding protein, partial [Gammaproteobacteria bacterium]|nr:AMP-binding protein [Gammaproteobacteria bacterium]